MYRHTYHFCWSITMIIEWSASVVHLIYFLANGYGIHCDITASCSVKQTLMLFVESILCRWIGLSTADQVEVCVYNNSVVKTGIGCQICVLWPII